MGQRSGLNLPYGPWYVVEVDVSINRIRDGKYDDLARKHFQIDQVNWIVNYVDLQSLRAKLRSTHGPVFCAICDYAVYLQKPVYSNDHLIGRARIIA